MDIRVADGSTWRARKDFGSTQFVVERSTSTALLRSVCFRATENATSSIKCFLQTSCELAMRKHGDASLCKARNTLATSPMM